MQDISAWVTGASLITMGVLALLLPGRIPKAFGGAADTVAARNEIRAVYGGFGLALGALVVWSVGQAELGEGVRLATAVSVAGMAAGRIVSVAADRAVGGMVPWIFFAIEVGLASLLLAGNAR